MRRRYGAGAVRVWLVAAFLGAVLPALPVRVAAQNVTATTLAELVSAMQAAAQTPGTYVIMLVAGRAYTANAPNNGDPLIGAANALPVIPNGTDLTILGNGAIIERSTAAGAPPFRLFGISIGGALRLHDLTLRNGLSRGMHGVNGGTNTSVPGGTGGDGNGGAIFNDGTLVIRGSMLMGNMAIGGAGGDGGNRTDIFTGGNGGSGGSGRGGAIYNSAAGTAFITNSTLTQNTATGGDGGNGGTGGAQGLAGQAGSGTGGAIYSERALDGTNVVIVGNSSVNGVAGHGAGTPGTPASVGGDIAARGVQGVVTLTNTIVASNVATMHANCANAAGGDVSDGGNNLEFPAGDCAFSTNAQTGDPLLDANGPQNHGGPTPTIALPFASPAVAHGNASVCATVVGQAPVSGVDQRGLPRPAACAIGPFEPQVAPTVTGITPTSGSISGGYTVTLSGTGFLPGATVAFDAVPIATIIVTATAIRFSAPAHSAGTVSVRITNPDGQSATTSHTFGAVTSLPVKPPVAPRAGNPIPLPGKRPQGASGGIPNPIPPRR